MNEYIDSRKCHLFDILIKIAKSAKEHLSRVKAKDNHELHDYPRAKAMAVSAEWAVKAALIR